MRPLLLARQSRRPDGLLGDLVGRIMARETAPENDAALDRLALGPSERLVEIGCGHGHTLAKAAAVAPSPAAPHSGLDFSWRMHLYAMRRHRRLVDAGGVEFRFSGSDRAPYPDAAFDAALSMHTVYFWTRPLDHLREMRRVLKTRGRLVLGFRPAEDPAFAAFPAEVYTIRSEAEVVALVREAGFAVDAVERRAFGRRQVTLLTARRVAVEPGCTACRHGAPAAPHREDHRAFQVH